MDGKIDGRSTGVRNGTIKTTKDGKIDKRSKLYK